MSIFKNIKFIAGGQHYKDLPEYNQSEFAFWGRSNVGKSSLINKLTFSSMAKTSQNPGRTQQINLFLIDNRYILADLPGYGYAALSKVDKARIHDLCCEYVMNREIRILFLLIDSRRGIMPIDQEIIEFLELNNINFYIVFTKNDLVKKPIILDNSKTINTSIRLNQGFDIIRNYIIKA